MWAAARRFEQQKLLLACSVSSRLGHNEAVPFIEDENDSRSVGFQGQTSDAPEIAEEQQEGPEPDNAIDQEEPIMPPELIIEKEKPEIIEEEAQQPVEENGDETEATTENENHDDATEFESKKRIFIQDFITDALFHVPPERIARRRPTRKEILSCGVFPQFLLDVQLITAPVAKAQRSGKGKEAKLDTSQFIIELIIGCSNPADKKQEPIRYFVKYIDVAYCHCEWLTHQEVASREGGKAKLKEFDKAKKKWPLMRSICIPHLLVLSNIELDPMWFNIEKVIDESNDDGKFEYLAKWRGLEYDQSTWESVVTIASKNHVQKYQQSLVNFNSKTIPSRWKRPSLSEYCDVTSIDNSMTGLPINGSMQKCINDIAKSYYKKINVIHADRSQLLQRQQIAAALDYLTDLTKFNGPILLLTIPSDTYAWKDQFEDWTGFNTVVYEGPKESLNAITEAEFKVVDQNGKILDNKIQADVIITSFKTFKKNCSYFGMIEWRSFVLDAAHFDKFNASFLQSIKTEHIIVAVNQQVLPDLSLFWDHLHFIAPGVFENKGKFFKKYQSTDATTCKELKNKTGSYIIEHFDYPDSDNYYMIEVEPTVEQIAEAKNLITNCSAVIQDTNPQNEPVLRYILSLMRLISNHPILVNHQKCTPREIIDQSAKYTFIDKILMKKTAQRKKFLIFSEIPDTLDLLEEILDFRSLKYMRSSATDSNDVFESLLDAFDESSEHRVFLYSSHSGARRIDTSIFSTIIALDDDTFRIRSDLECHIYHLVTGGFPDESLYCRNLCYDESAIYSVSSDGPFPCPFDYISSILISSYYRMMLLKPQDRAKFKGRPFEDIIRYSGRHQIGKRYVDINAQWNPYFTKPPYCRNLEEMIASIHDIGMRHRSYAHQITRQALLAHKNPTPNESGLLMKLLKKAPRIRHKINEEMQTIKINSSQICHDACFFIRVQRALASFTSDSDFPEVEGSTIQDDYDVFYHLFLGGITWTIQQITEGKIKCPVNTPEGIVARVEKILDIFDLDQHDPSLDFFYYRPINSERWMRYYPEQKRLRALARSEFQKYMNSNIGQKVLFNKEPDHEAISEEEQKKDGRKRGRKPKVVKEEEEDDDNEEDDSGEEEEDSDDDEDNDDSDDGEDEEEEETNKNEAQKKATKKQSKKKDSRKAVSTLFEFLPKSESTPAATVIYNAMLDRGTPQEKKKNGEWEYFIKISNIKYEKSKVKTIANKHIEIATKTIGEGTSTDISNDPELRKFGSKYTVEASKALLFSIKAMSSVYSINNLLKSNKFVLKETKIASGFPPWWTIEHCRMLVEAIAQYGSYSFFKWIVDPHFSFLTQIPQNLLSSFKIAATHEKQGTLTKQIIPTDLGDFAMLSRRSFRLDKISWIAEEISKQALIESKLPISKKLPSSGYLLEPSDKLRIISFGQISKNPNFSGQFCPFPVGFVSERYFRGKDSVGRWYRCEIQESAGKPLFSVTLINKPSHIWYGSTPREVWTLVQTFWKGNEVIRVGGMFLFGIVNAKVLSVFGQMAKSKTWNQLPVKLQARSATDGKIIVPDE